jgi:hypothetical protein
MEHTAALYAVSTSLDDHGAEKMGLTALVATRFARLEDGRGKEIFESGAPVSQSDAELRIHLDAILTPKMRVVVTHGRTGTSVTYEVLSVTHDELWTYAQLRRVW